jgi:Flp pilus assembly protein TadG
MRVSANAKMDILRFGRMFRRLDRFSLLSADRNSPARSRQAMSRNLPKCLRRLIDEVARFGGTRDAAMAVEFAFIAPPFLATLIAIFEVTIFLFAQQVLQNGAMEAGRLFMTGQEQNSFTQNSDTTAQQQLAQFKTDICPQISMMFDCNSSSLMVNVRSYSDFSSADGSEPQLTFDAQGNVTNSWSWAPGTPGQVMVVQLIYQWPIVNGPLGYVLSSLGNGHAEMMGVSAFRVEPYR